MTESLLILLAEGAAANPLQKILGSPAIFPIALIIIFYFMLIRPQQQQKKELNKKIDALKKGDKVITNGGIHGVVNHKGDKTISLKVSEGVFITMESANISVVTPKGDAKEEEASEEKK